MTNLNEIAKILLQAKEELKTCKRNKSGTLNGNAKFTIVKRAAAALMEAGESRTDAYAMAWDTVGR